VAVYLDGCKLAAYSPEDHLVVCLPGVNAYRLLVLIACRTLVQRAFEVTLPSLVTSLYYIGDLNVGIDRLAYVCDVLVVEFILQAHSSH
jgi:hypothetical protein